MRRSSSQVSAVWVPTMPWCRSVTRQVVLVVVGEQELILGLGHVVDAARVRRVEDLLLYKLALIGLDLDRRMPSRICIGQAVSVDAHGPQMHHVDVEPLSVIAANRLLVALRLLSTV